MGFLIMTVNLKSDERITLNAPGKSATITVQELATGGAYLYWMTGENTVAVEKPVSTFEPATRHVWRLDGQRVEVFAVQEKGRVRVGIKAPRCINIEVG